MELADARVKLRPLGYRDRRWWHHAQRENHAWLQPWEATYPDQGYRPPSFRRMVRTFAKDARRGGSENLIIICDQERVGFISLSAITYGPARSAHIGYWIIEKFANQGIVTHAVALLQDHAFNDLRLHRIEINIRPENHASIRVAMKSGFELEGRRAKYLHIDGQWRDHLSFVATRD